MNQEDDVYPLPRDVYDNAKLHYKALYALLIQKGEMKIVEVEP